MCAFHDALVAALIGWFIDVILFCSNFYGQMVLYDLYYTCIV
jgi:hypothetical protein